MRDPSRLRIRGMIYTKKTLGIEAARCILLAVIFAVLLGVCLALMLSGPSPVADAMDLKDNLLAAILMAEAASVTALLVIVASYKAATALYRIDLLRRRKS